MNVYTSYISFSVKHFPIDLRTKRYLRMTRQCVKDNMFKKDWRVCQQININDWLANVPKCMIHRYNRKTKFVYHFLLNSISKSNVRSRMYISVRERARSHARTHTPHTHTHTRLYEWVSKWVVQVSEWMSDRLSEWVEDVSIHRSIDRFRK